MTDSIAELIVVLILGFLGIALFGGLYYLLYFEVEQAEASARSESPRTGRVQRWLALLIGIVWTLRFVATDRNPLARSLSWWAEMTLYLGPLSVIFALLSRRLLSGRVAMIFLFASGCAIGIVSDVSIDFKFFGVDHNLFPFEIVGSWIRLMPFAIIGTVVGWWFPRRPIEIAQ